MNPPQRRTGSAFQTVMSSKYPSLPATHNNLGALAYRLGRIDEAERSYREALRLNPNYGEAHRNLGLVLLSRRDFAAAAAEFSTALQLNPASTEAQRDLAQAYLGLGIDAVRELVKE